MERKQNKNFRSWRKTHLFRSETQNGQWHQREKIRKILVERARLGVAVEAAADRRVLAARGVLVRPHCQPARAVLLFFLDLKYRPIRDVQLNQWAKYMWYSKRGNIKYLQDGDFLRHALRQSGYD
jgi:hypothetical protein